MVNRFTVFIINENIQDVEHLTKLLSIDRSLTLIGSAHSARQGTEEALIKKPDIIFLGIDFSKKSGFDIIDALHSFRFNPAIVFTENTDKYAFNAINYRPYAYLLKPYTEEKIKETIYKIVHNLKSVNIKRTLFELQSSDILINIDDVIYCEIEGKEARIILSNKEKYTFTMPLKELVKKFHTHNFYKCYRSFIINLDYLKEIDRKAAEVSLMKGNEVFKVSISPQGIKYLKELYSD